MSGATGTCAMSSPNAARRVCDISAVVELALAQDGVQLALLLFAHALIMRGERGADPEETPGVSLGSVRLRTDTRRGERTRPDHKRSQTHDE